MKSITKFSIIIAAIVFIQGCKKDFLNRPPLNTPTSGAFYKTDEQIMAGTAPLYNIVWFDYNDKAFLAFGEARGGNLNSNDRTAYIQFSVSSTDQSTLLAGYKSFYKIVAQSNVTMQSINGATGSTASDAGKRAGLGECHFMRGLAYYYLVNTWGAVPIVYDNASQLSNDLQRNTIESVWEFIIRDMTFAAKNLPDAPLAQGRLTRWSAEAMLAKMYLTRAGVGKIEGSRLQADLDSAKRYAGNVIKNSPYTLLPNYYDLFRSENNNSSRNNGESLFALQWMPNASVWGINNSFQAYMAFDPKITQTGDGWGAVQGGSADLVKYYVNNPNDSIRRKATLMFNGDYYPELDKEHGGITVTTTSIANIKKYVVGSPKDNGQGAFMAAYINTYMLRMAEVYLIYAEAIMGNNVSTSDAEALQYFNAVRNRAGIAPKSSITFDDIFQEKRIETAIEGNAWYEIMRLYYFNPAKAKAYVASQDKGNYTINYIAGSTNPRRWNVTYTPAYYSFNEQNVYLPFPETELNIATQLTSEPVPFDFSQLPD